MISLYVSLNMTFVGVRMLSILEEENQGLEGPGFLPTVSTVGFRVGRYDMGAQHVAKGPFSRRTISHPSPEQKKAFNPFPEVRAELRVLSAQSHAGLPRALSF